MFFTYIGDPHCTLSTIDDCQKMVDFVFDICQKTKSTALFAGDLYDHHAIINSEVQYFWWSTFDKFQKGNIPVIVLNGNHDKPGTLGSPATALVAHVSQGRMVLNEPYVEGKLLFCPYTTPEQLVEWSNQHPECNTIFTHASFDGAQFQDGFYDPHGVNPDLIKQNQIISGHVHKSQSFGKVWFPGSPRWLTLNDANQDKSIYLLEFNDEGILINKTPYDTGTVCKKIYHFIDTPDNPVSFTPIPNVDYRVDIRGPESWLKERLPLFEGIAKVRRIRTGSKMNVVVKESEGVNVAFNKWVDKYVPKNGTPKEELKELVKERNVGF